jgi:hypothetical protein
MIHRIRFFPLDPTPTKKIYTLFLYTFHITINSPHVHENVEVVMFDVFLLTYALNFILSENLKHLLFSSSKPLTVLVDARLEANYSFYQLVVQVSCNFEPISILRLIFLSSLFPPIEHLFSVFVDL